MVEFQSRRRAKRAPWKAWQQSKKRYRGEVQVDLQFDSSTWKRQYDGVRHMAIPSPAIYSNHVSVPIRSLSTCHVFLMVADELWAQYIYTRSGICLPANCCCIITATNTQHKISFVHTQHQVVAATFTNCDSESSAATLIILSSRSTGGQKT